MWGRRIVCWEIFFARPYVKSPLMFVVSSSRYSSVSFLLTRKTSMESVPSRTFANPASSVSHGGLSFNQPIRLFPSESKGLLRRYAFALFSLAFIFNISSSFISSYFFLIDWGISNSFPIYTFWTSLDISSGSINFFGRTNCVRVSK